jgi:GNAT superfamily N-acetyltransferase
MPPDKARRTAFRDHLDHSWLADDSFRDSVARLVVREDTQCWLAAAEEQSSPVAVCQLRFRHSVWTGVDDCWLEDLFVRDDARRRGLARALVERVMDRGRERGCRRIELDTNEDNLGAITLYESLGFSGASKGGSRGLLFGAKL